MTARDTWQAAVYRACDRCIYGRTADGRPSREADQPATHCVCECVTYGASPVEVGAARAMTGWCGPEARHQDFPGLHAAAPA